jgi:SAM-dependent methyltransferase
MFKTSRYYEKLIPAFLKKLIDPDSFRIQRFVKSAILETTTGDRILDAGAGECQNRALIENQIYIALDAAWGDQSWDYSDLDVIASLEKTPFKPDSFDLLICTQVMEHVNEPQVVLNEFFRIAKGGGTICISAPQGWGVHQAPYDFFRYTHFGLRHLLEKSGFEIISITPSCGYYGYLANRLTVFPKTFFWQIKQGWLRLLLSPLELISYGIFVLLLPIILNSIDFMDKNRNYTLNYFVLARKPTAEHAI